LAWIIGLSGESEGAKKRKTPKKLKEDKKKIFWGKKVVIARSNIKTP